MVISGSDPVAAALYGALDGLALRQRVTANNIANIDTPGYLAQKVDFESSLRSAIDSGTVTQGIAPSTSTSTDSPGPDGNNVDLGNEEMQAMQDTFRYQLLSRAVGERFNLVTTAIGGM